MRTYVVLIEETLSREIEVKAANEQDALNEVYAQIESEKIVLDADDFDNNRVVEIVDILDDEGT